MNLYKLVFRNLLGRKTRFIFTLSGITLGIIALVVLISLGTGLQAQIHKQANDLGANLIVTAKGWCAYEQVKVLSGKQLPDAILPNELSKIEKIKGIKTFPYLTVGSAIKNEPVSVTGAKIEQVKELKKWKTTQGDFPKPSDTYGMVAGSSIAQRFKLSVGKTLTLRGQEFKITGILDTTGTGDDGVLFIGLDTARKVYETKGRISFIGVKVDNISRVEYYSNVITDTANVAVLSDKQMLSSVLSVVNSVSTTLNIIAIIAVLAASFGIINTMLTAIYERKKEIGILKSMGSSNFQIFNIFVIESGFYGLIGGMFGLIVGTATSFFITPFIAQNEFTAFVRSTEVSGILSVSDMFMILFGSVIVATLSGIYPALRAAKLTPVEAISYE